MGSRLDTLHRVVTPEGCEIDLHVAGPVARARAWFIDFLIRFALWVLLAIAGTRLGDPGAVLLLLGAFLLEWFYPILFEVYAQGQTPGKRSCGLAVVHDDGRPVGWSGAFIRNALRGVDFLPLGYAAGFVSTLLDGQGRRLGDLAAGTLVVHVHRTPRPAEEADGADGSEAPPFALTREEHIAIIEYTRRVTLLTPERAAELALAAGPLTAGLDGEAAKRRLLRIGNFLLGGQST
ncbi:RDD family protein [Accumulibacter sp.]|uniref:RDD family protein n=1 Tax=Accumulibacter sp. TaxID=2053492 RepID=UPI0025CEED3E|nr:RDD family protein [Accumulibacter sp.]MCM8595213.1 RDD family protein [Accumulibacter sp.]MCM8625173.1 RDD family protein [Accumulibacter sp.]MDS4049359.1 RDD family protein [Accumulibacter sp.]